jgi:hypothetical protein
VSFGIADQSSDIVRAQKSIGEYARLGKTVKKLDQHKVTKRTRPYAYGNSAMAFEESWICSRWFSSKDIVGTADY